MENSTSLPHSNSSNNNNNSVYFFQDMTLKTEVGGLRYEDEV